MQRRQEGRSGEKVKAKPALRGGRRHAGEEREMDRMTDCRRRGAHGAASTLGFLKVYLMRFA